jgi:hypothetical protein
MIAVPGAACDEKLEAAVELRLGSEMAVAPVPFAAAEVAFECFDETLDQI